MGRRILRSGGGLQLTSGTTGHPKAWVKTYRSWQAVIDHNLHHFDTFGPGVPPVGPDDVNLHFHPIQWASGFQTLYPYYVRGARTVLLDDEVFHPSVLLDTIASEQVTGVFMPGPLLTPVLDEIEARGGFTHRLRRMVVFFGNPDQLDLTTVAPAAAGAALPGETLQQAATAKGASDHRTLTVRLAPLPGDCRGTGVIEALTR